MEYKLTVCSNWLFVVVVYCPVMKMGRLGTGREPARCPAVLLVRCHAMESVCTGMLPGHPCVQWTHCHPWVFSRQVHIHGVHAFAYPVKTTGTMICLGGLASLGSVFFGGPSHLGFTWWLSRWICEGLSWRYTKNHKWTGGPKVQTAAFDFLVCLSLSQSLACM